MKKAAFCTLGCKVNQYETEAITELFASSGYETVPFDEKADVYVINTCSVTNIGDRKSRQMIRRARKHNSGAVVIVTGCYAQTAAEEVLAIDDTEDMDAVTENADTAEDADTDADDAPAAETTEE